MTLRSIKEQVNKFVNVFIKSYNIATDKRLTPRPIYEVFFNERAGIKHPEVTPTLPLLKYVCQNSPAIKIATVRLRESIFRRGFEWERNFEAKCMDCLKEFEDIVQVCDDCGSKNIDIPNKLEIKRAEKFFERCTIYDEHKAGKRKLLHLLKELEDDLNIFDDAYLVGIKEYWQDAEGNIKLTSLHQILRGNPVTMRLVADEFGEPGGRWYTCLRHRDVIEEVADKKCPKCNRKLYEVHYVSVEGGGDNPLAYYIGDEVIHVSKYSPTSLYGFSPIVTLWQYVLTLTNMVEYIYRSYSEAHLPKGVLAMKTSNPDSAMEFWRDVDDKLNKDPHYIPKMFLEGDGNGTGSGMEFIKFMDTLEEMQYIPVRDEIRRTIASMYGVTNIFIGDTAGAGGLNADSTQIDITNMAAEAGIAVYNDHIMPELLHWLNVNDWSYVLRSPFEENKQRELNEQQTKVGIAQSMLQMGFKVDLGEEDVFDFKYSGESQDQSGGQPVNPDGGVNEPGGGFTSNPEQGNENDTFNDSDIKMGIQKARIYVKHPKEAPQGVKVLRSLRGSYYYDTQKPSPYQDMRPRTDENKRKRIEALLHNTTEHYDNLLEEYKQSKDVNPTHSLSLQNDLNDTRQLIQQLHINYRDMLGDEPEELDKAGGRSININIQKMEDKFIELKKNHDDELEILKYDGQEADTYQVKKFKNELNRIFDDEIAKILNSTDKFAGAEQERFVKKCLDDAIFKMEAHTRRHLEMSYREGQKYVGELVGKAIDFSKVDKAALHAITSRNVLWQSYENLSKSTSEKFNEVIKRSFADPKTYSIPNIVKDMRMIADNESYRLEKIARTESHVAAMKGREISFQKSDPENENLYKWVIKRDSRTSGVCLDIEKQVNAESNGKGVSLQRLKDIIKENSLRYNGPTWEYRDFQPHISCRSALVRAF